MTAQQYPGLRWTGLQGFSTREEARRAARATAARQDPERPGMRWVIRDIRCEGRGQWRADHYVVLGTLSCQNGGVNAWECLTAGCDRPGHAASFAQREGRTVAAFAEYLGAALLPEAAPDDDQDDQAATGPRCEGFERVSHATADATSLYPVPGTGQPSELRELCPECHAALVMFWGAGIPAQCRTCRCCSILLPGDAPDVADGCAGGRSGLCHASAPAAILARNARISEALAGPLDNGRPYSDAPAPEELNARDRHELALVARAMGADMGELLQVHQAPPARHDDQDPGQYTQRLAHLCTACGRGHFCQAEPCTGCPSCGQAAPVAAQDDDAHVCPADPDMPCPIAAHNRQTPACDQDAATDAAILAAQEPPAPVLVIAAQLLTCAWPECVRRFRPSADRIGPYCGYLDCPRAAFLARVRPGDDARTPTGGVVFTPGPSEACRPAPVYPCNLDVHSHHTRTGARRCRETHPAPCRAVDGSRSQPLECGAPAPRRIRYAHARYVGLNDQEAIRAYCDTHADRILAVSPHCYQDATDAPAPLAL